MAVMSSALLFALRRYAYWEFCSVHSIIGEQFRVISVQRSAMSLPNYEVMGYPSNVTDERCVTALFFFNSIYVQPHEALSLQITLLIV